MRVRKTAEYCSFRMNTLGFFWIPFVNKFQIMKKLICLDSWLYLEEYDSK